MMGRGKIVLVIVIIVFCFSRTVSAAETPVAMVGNIAYTSLAEALRAADKFAIVRLITDAVWDEECDNIAKAVSLCVESYDSENFATLTITSNLHFTENFTFRSLNLKFTEAAHRVFAQGHMLLIGDSVEMVGPVYPIIYGGGDQGENLGSVLIIEGGTYQGIYGGSAGTPQGGLPQKGSIYLGKNVTLATGGIVSPGNEENDAHPEIWLILNQVGSLGSPFAGIAGDFSEITVYGDQIDPAYVRLGEGGNASFRTVSLGSNAYVAFQGQEEIVVATLQLLEDTAPDQEPVIIKNDDSLLNIATGNTGSLSCGVIVTSGDDGVFSLQNVQISAPFACNFQLFSPDGYELSATEERDDSTRQWKLTHNSITLGAPTNARWSEDGGQILWDWTGPTIGMDGFCLELYKDEALYQTYAVPQGSGTLSYDLAAVLAEGGEGAYRASIYAKGADGNGDGAIVWTETFDYIPPPDTVSINGIDIFYEIQGEYFCLMPSETQMRAILQKGVLVLPALAADVKGYRLDFLCGWMRGENSELRLMAPYGYCVLTEALFAENWNDDTECGILLAKNDVGIYLGFYKNGLAVPLPGNGFALSLGIAFDGEMTAKANYVVYHKDSEGILPQCVFQGAAGYLHFLTPVVGSFYVMYNEKYFNDLNDGAWYAQAMYFMTAREIIRGVGNGLVAPDANVLRADFLIMVMRSFGIPLESDLADNFADAGNAYYTDYLATAKKWGIVNGIGNNCFNPQGEITREEMFKMLYEVLLVLGRIEPVQADLSCYQDYPSIHSWALTAVMALQARGDIGGWDGKLHPGEQAPRSHAVQILYNLLTKQVPEEL